MGLLQVAPGRSLRAACEFSEIFSGSKKQHFEKLRASSGLGGAG